MFGLIKRKDGMKMKKRFINLLLCTTLLVLLLPASAVFAGTYPVGPGNLGHLTYEITDGEVTITELSLIHISTFNPPFGSWTF